MSTPRPQMKQRGGRRRARAAQRARHQKIVAYAEMFQYRGYSPGIAILRARLCVDMQEYWHVPDDPFKSELWTGAAS